MKLADSTDVSCMMYSQLLHKTDETALCTPQWVEVGHILNGQYIIYHRFSNTPYEAVHKTLCFKSAIVRA